MANRFLLVLVVWCLFPFIGGTQNEAFELFEQRADELRIESKALETKQKKLSQQINDLQVENKRLRFNAVYNQKELVRNETALRQAMRDLYDTDYNLRVKISEIELLGQQIRMLQTEKDSLSKEIGNLNSMDSLLKKQLDVVRAELSYISRDNQQIKDAAKKESVGNSMQSPRGYRRGKLSVLVAEGGLLNIAKGGSTNLAVYTYLLPSKNILGGFGIGADFYSNYKSDGVNYGSFFLAPVTASIRGNFGPQDFFTLKRDPETVRFNINWLIDFGWSFLIRDTDTADSYAGNAVMSGGIGMLWPQHRNFGIGFSSLIRVQRIKKFDALDNSDAILFPMFILKLSFFLRK